MKKYSLPITSYFDEEKFVESWKKVNTGLKTAEDEAKKIVDSNTKLERDALEKAWKQVEIATDAYEKKVNTVTSSEKFKKIKENLETYQKEVSRHVNTALKVYKEEEAKILNSNLSDKDKAKSISTVQEYIISRLYSPEDVKAFKNRIIVINL